MRDRAKFTKGTRVFRVEWTDDDIPHIRHGRVCQEKGNRRIEMSDGRRMNMTDVHLSMMEAIEAEIVSLAHYFCPSPPWSSKRGLRPWALASALVALKRLSRKLWDHGLLGGQANDS